MQHPHITKNWNMLAAPLASPDNDAFSTPPTTPFIAPNLSRRSSKPSSINVEHRWHSDVELDPTHSPAHRKHLPFTPNTAAIRPQNSEPGPNPHLPILSPCFVHSHLDKGASLTDWVRKKHQSHEAGGVGVANSLKVPSANFMGPSQSHPSPMIHNDDEDKYSASLTEQLAETAVGVREMSKQLGRARIMSNIQSILIITKARDNRLIKLTRELAIYLMQKKRKGQSRGMIVYVDNQLRRSRRFDAEGIARDHPEFMVPYPRRRSSSNNSLAAPMFSKDDYYNPDEGQLRYWTSDMCMSSPHLFDFVITLGGDGTVLFTSWLFQRIVPPVLPFALGSLGFLTNFDFADHQAVVDSAIDSGIRVNLRMRFTCTVYRAVAAKDDRNRRKAVKKASTGEIMMKNLEKDGWEALEGGWSGGPVISDSKKDKEIMCFTTRPVETFEVLNDLVVDRGPSPYVSLLELFGDEHHMTTVQADGLTISTPTGSTAYSLSAGGSLVHPEIPAILITPICPHTLSFRPMLLPDTMELRICVPFNSRSTAWASFDGRGRVELKQGDHIKVTASKFPFPTVCADKQSTDWFHSISRTLKWNERERQKSFVVVEEGPSKPKRKEKKGATDPSKPVEVIGNEELGDSDEEDEVSDEEEDDQFDIDDSSPEAAHKIISQRQVAEANMELVSSPERDAHLQPPSSKRNRSRSRSRGAGVRSGVQTPGRFAGNNTKPPLLPKFVDFDMSSGASTPISTTSSDSESLPEDWQDGTRDDIHATHPSMSSGKSRIPKDRDLEVESVRTPTISHQTLHSHKRHSHRAESGEHAGVPRAFAVWGHDESDSSANDDSA